MYWGEVGDKYVKLLMKNNLYFDEDGKQVNATKYYERCEEVVDDMSNLSVLNDPQLLHNIHFRYQKDILFTYVGPTLLVVNPFKRIEGIFEQQKFFRDKIVTQKINFKDLHPHTFAIAAQALKMLSVKNQAIAISGESGAGKTENAKYCMNLLTLEGQMSEKILACNPILEAFGNAKTARNDNSSRFGKYCRLYVQNDNVIGAQIINYLLEKSRVISQGPNDHNFHIFYFIEEESQYRKNKKPQDLQELIRDFQTVGIDHVFVLEIVRAVLLIGNIEFDDSILSDNSPCKIMNPLLLQQVCTILKNDPVKVEQSLVYKLIPSKERILSPIRKSDCIQKRDAWAKEIYERLFCWIIEEMNKTLKLESNKYIGLLDIYGFEVFDDGNYFEQILINYTNERLHQLYIDYVFKEEERIFQSEGIDQKIKFNDNKLVIELFDKAPVCLFNIIDQSSKLNQDDNKLLTSIRKELKFPQSFKQTFVIKHTAKDVEYTCLGFVEKNMDEIPVLLVEAQGIIKFEVKPKSICQKIKKEIGDLMSELQSCGVHFIRCIKPNDDPKKPNRLDPPFAMRQIRYLGILDSLKVRKDNFSIRLTYENFYNKYRDITNYALSDQYQTQVEKMFKDYFVGVDKKFGKTLLFLMEIKKIDEIYKQLIAQKASCAKKIQKSYRAFKFRQKVKILMRRIKKLKIRLHKFHLRIRLRVIMKAAILIFKFLKLFQVKRKIKQNKQKIKYLFQVVQTFAAKQQKKRILRNVIKIQILYRAKKFREHIKARLYAKKLINQQIDRFWKKYIGYKAVLIQSNYRGWITRKHYSQQVEQIQRVGTQLRYMKKVKIIQKHARGYLVRSRLKKLHQAAYYIQGYFKMRMLSDIFQRMRMAAVYIQRRFRELMPKRRLYKEGYSKYIAPMEQQYLQQKQREEIDLFGMNKIDYESVLSQGMDSLVHPKIYLFAFIIDLEVLQDTSDIYESTFAQNYKKLFLNCFQKEQPIQTIHIGENHSIAVSNNKIYGWGMSQVCQLGQVNEDIQSPMSLQIPGKIKQLETGSNFTVMLQDDKAFIWGLLQNKLIDHPVVFQENVKMIKVFRDTIYHISNRSLYENLRLIKNQVSSVSVGGDFVIMITDQGLFSYGSNERGQLGLGDRIKRNQPNKIMLQDKIIQVECGLKHVICLSSLKKVYTWGWNLQGQCGLDNFNDVTQPQLNMFYAEQVMAGLKSSIILYHQQLYWCGSNGTIVSQSQFQQINNKCQYINRKEYSPVRVLTSYSTSVSIIFATYACTRGVFDTQPSKQQKILSTLTQKWIEFGIHNIDPPFVEHISNYISERHQRKSNKLQQSPKEETDIDKLKQRIKQLRELPREEWSSQDVLLISKLY